MPGPLYAGIDIGTSGIRIIVIDDNGAVVARVAATLASIPAGREAQLQDPEPWWQTIMDLFRRLGTQLSLGDIRALSIDATSTTLLLTDQTGTPVSPAMMYYDNRAQLQARELAAAAPADSIACGAGSSLAKLLWLKNTYPGARHALHQADWIMAKFTGRPGISDENNALKLGYDAQHRRWPDWLGAVDFDSSWLPEVVAVGTPVDTVCAAAGRACGLSRQTQVIAGTTDGVASFLATGATRPGDAVTSLGSTLVLKLLTRKPLSAPEFGIYSHRIGDRWLAGGASNSGGAVLAQFFDAGQITRLSEQIDTDKPAGLDYYPLPARGERFPIADDALEPRLQPRPERDSLFLQGMLEGIAAIEARGYQLLNELGADTITGIRTVGSGAGNPAWLKIRAARLPAPLQQSTHTEAAYGMATLARQGTL